MQRFKRERALSSAGSERLPYKQRVGGSNPSAPTKETYLAFRFRPITEETLESSTNHFKGRLAQLVQSVCLTSRGSGVRIPQRPLKNKTKNTLSLILFIHLQVTPLPPGQQIITTPHATPHIWYNRQKWLVKPPQLTKYQHDVVTLMKPVSSKLLFYDNKQERKMPQLW